jgi:hypothetical protein
MSENNKSIGLNELVDYKPKSYSPFMEKVMKFLWKCSGADPDILKFAPYSDHIKSAGIGGVVLATAFMAALAMGFAMHSIFGGENAAGEHVGNWFVTLPIAIVWGLIIYNLDRFIVTTAKGDGTEKITWGEWGAMLPRLIMAVLIGLCISAPLETYIFKKEIQREWGISMKDLATSERLKIESNNNVLNQRNQADVKKVKDKIAIQQEKYDKANDEYQNELSGKNDKNGYGNGPVAKAKKEIVDRELAELVRLRNELKPFETDEVKFKKSIEEQKTKVEQEILQNKPGFLDQIMMLERLSSHGKAIPKIDPKTNEAIKGEEVEIYPSAFWPIWLVRLLFMIVEIAPVVFKFMIWKSSYDYMQDNVAQILEAKQGISLEYIIDENNKMHKVKENYNARRIVEVSKRQNDLEKENAIHAITLYAEQEREAMEKNPEKFIQNQGEPSVVSQTQDNAMNQDAAQQVEKQQDETQEGVTQQVNIEQGNANENVLDANASEPNADNPTTDTSIQENPEQKINGNENGSSDN